MVLIIRICNKNRNIRKIELKIIKELQKGYPLCEKPYKKIAENLNIKVEGRRSCRGIVDEKTLLGIIRNMKKNKVIRRTGVTLSHYRLGLKSNAMVVWNVDDNKVDRIGKIIASFSFVSHCYERIRIPNWEYNLYSMVHAKTKSELSKNINKIAKAIKVKDYLILNSVKEFKKTSPNFN